MSDMSDDLDALLSALSVTGASRDGLEGLEGRVWTQMDRRGTQARDRARALGVQLAVGATALCLGFVWRAAQVERPFGMQLTASSQTDMMMELRAADGSGFQAVH